MTTFFRGITESILSLFRGIFSERNSVANPTPSNPGSIRALWQSTLKLPSSTLSTLTLQRQNTEFSKQILPEKEYRDLGPNFHIHASVSDLYISTIGLPILLEEICRPILGLYKSAHRHMNVEIGGAEAGLSPEKEYINGIFVAVHALSFSSLLCMAGVKCWSDRHKTTGFPSLAVNHKKLVRNLLYPAALRRLSDRTYISR